MVVLETRQVEDQLGLSNLYLLEVAENYVLLPWRSAATTSCFPEISWKWKTDKKTAGRTFVEHLLQLSQHLISRQRRKWRHKEMVCSSSPSVRGRLLFIYALFHSGDARVLRKPWNREKEGPTAASFCTVLLITACRDWQNGFRTFPQTSCCAALCDLSLCVSVALCVCVTAVTL